MKHWQELGQILDRVLHLAREGRPAALAIVTRIRGSAYRRPGAKLLVEDDGSLLGGVSGGCLEEDVRQVGSGRPPQRRLARAPLRDGRRRHQGLGPGPGLRRRGGRRRPARDRRRGAGDVGEGARPPGSGVPVRALDRRRGRGGRADVGRGESRAAWPEAWRTPRPRPRSKRWPGGAARPPLEPPRGRVAHGLHRGPRAAARTSSCAAPVTTRGPWSPSRPPPDSASSSPTIARRI